MATILADRFDCDRAPNSNQVNRQQEHWSHTPGIVFADVEPARLKSDRPRVEVQRVSPVRKRYRGSVAAMLAVLVLGLAGCSPDRPLETASSVDLPTLDGGQIDFGDLEGQDVFLWFWAPW